MDRREADTAVRTIPLTHEEGTIQAYHGNGGRLQGDKFNSKFLQRDEIM
jgi:hypothetical protein